MKPARPTLFWFAAAVSAFAADGIPASLVAPQPRARLMQTSSGVARQADASATTPLPQSHPIIVMSKYVVRDSPVTEGAPQPVEPESKKFSLLDGGPMWSGKLGSLPVDVGLWRPIDIMPETAKFRPQQTQAEFGFLRIKF